MGLRPLTSLLISFISLLNVTGMSLEAGLAVGSSADSYLENGKQWTPVQLVTDKAHALAILPGEADGGFSNNLFYCSSEYDGCYYEITVDHIQSYLVPTSAEELVRLIDSTTKSQGFATDISILYSNEPAVKYVVELRMKSRSGIFVKRFYCSYSGILYRMSIEGENPIYKAFDTLRILK